MLVTAKFQQERRSVFVLSVLIKERANLITRRIIVRIPSLNQHRERKDTTCGVIAHSFLSTGSPEEAKDLSVAYLTELK